MKSILVPTDFSKCAGNAMQHAMEIARTTGATITVLHVVFPNEGVDNNVYNVFWSDEYMAERIKGLDNWVKRYRRPKQFQKIPVKVECLTGFPVPAICDMADSIDADLIVMGTTGATGLRGVFLGSIAAGVMTKTRRPLLAIPKKAGTLNLKNMVFATDFRWKVDDHTGEVLTDLLNMHKGKLHVLNILDKPGEHPDKNREQTFSYKVGSIPHDFHYVHDRDIAQAISNFIEGTDGGLLVAIAHEHSLLHRLFFDSITRRLAHRINIPMLALHDAA